jgi:hypothetical protein
VSLNILNVVDLGSEGILDVNDDDLPVGLTLVKECHDTEDLDLLDLANIPDLLTDLADIKRVVVSLRLGFGVGLRRVLPSLNLSMSIKAESMVVCRHT